MFTIDIDTGGTFTDGFFTRDGDFKTAKVLTTPHDLTVCLMDCIREGARLFGVTLREMLSSADVVRYSTTTGVNALITRTGSKIGLIVTRGYGASLYADTPDEAQGLSSLVNRDLVVEVEESIDENGRVVTSLSREEIIESMQRLIDSGARAIAVSLRNSHANPDHERKVKAVVKEQYPNFYLGSVRVFLASELSDKPGDFPRTNTVVVNGYIHDALVKYLYKGEDELRTNYCAHPLMVAHSHGGVARVAKTRAIDTYSSGPSLGVIGAGSLGAMYGLSRVITVDVGGTSLDLGFIRDGVYDFSQNPVIGGFPVSIPMITTHSAPVASGSIARVDSTKKLAVGPKSAGARPGPACFDLGGIEPTVTDADVVLGFIDPSYFLGGRIKLNRARAETAIGTRIANRLGVTVQEAAWMIRQEVGRATSDEILRFAEARGVGEKDLEEFAVVIYGGAGPTHYCDFAKRLRFGQCIAAPYASVFSAFGSSTTDLLHTYSRFLPLDLVRDGVCFSDYERLNAVVRGLVETAARDIRGEGFSPSEAVYRLELTTGFNSRILTDRLFIESEQDLRGLLEQSGDGDVSLISVSLSARVPMPHLSAREMEMAGPEPDRALKTSRRICWSPESGETETPVFERDRLVPGNVVAGPSVVEAKDTTYVIPEGMSLHVDRFSNAVIKG